jgi:predicted helicase
MQSARSIGRSNDLVQLLSQVDMGSILKNFGQRTRQEDPVVHFYDVKFIRFGQWRIERTGSGILAFITNHSYLDNPTFCGMRQSLEKTFNDIYLMDLHSNSRKKEVATDGSPDKNVFDIQQLIFSKEWRSLLW